MKESEAIDALRQFGQVYAFGNELNGFDEVRMVDAVMIDDDFRLFHHLKKLRAVRVFSRDVKKRSYTSQALGYLLALPNIQEVNLDYQNVNLRGWHRNVPAKINERMDAVWALSGFGESYIDLGPDGDVTSIRMLYSRIANEDFRHFQALKSLRHLSVARSLRYSDDALQYLSEMTHLEVLSLECVSHDAWRQIRRCLPTTMLSWRGERIGPEEAEFSYQGEVVGYFDKSPCEPGQYEATFYGTPLEMVEAHREGQIRCQSVSDPRRSFAIINWHARGRLDLDDFRTEEM